MTDTYSLFWGYKLPSLQRIALSGLFIALACILNKVLAVNYIPAVPFVRLSFGGPAIIIFAGFLLGPIYGAFIGFAQDFIGYLIFDPKVFGWAPTIASTYILLGFVSGFIFYLFKKIKSKRLSQIITYISLTVILLGLSAYIIASDNVVWQNVNHHIDLWMKIVFPLAMVSLLVILITYIEISNKKHKFDDLPINIYQLTLGLFVMEILIMTLYGSLMKSVLFGFDIFLVILFCQAMTMLFNVPFNIIILTLIMKTTKRYYINKDI